MRRAPDTSYRTPPRLTIPYEINTAPIRNYTIIITTVVQSVALKSTDRCSGYTSTRVEESLHCRSCIQQFRTRGLAESRPPLRVLQGTASSHLRASGTGPELAAILWCCHLIQSDCTSVLRSHSSSRDGTSMGLYFDGAGLSWHTR